MNKVKILILSILTASSIDASSACFKIARTATRQMKMPRFNQQYSSRPTYQFRKDGVHIMGGTKGEIDMGHQVRDTLTHHYEWQIFNLNKLIDSKEQQLSYTMLALYSSLLFVGYQQIKINELEKTIADNHSK